MTNLTLGCMHVHNIKVSIYVKKYSTVFTSILNYFKTNLEDTLAKATVRPNGSKAEESK